jgi:hypothetical protein
MEPLRMGDRPTTVAAGQAGVCVIVILQDRPEPLEVLYREYAAVLRDAGYVANFIFISGRDMRHRMEPLLPLMRDGEPIQVLEAAQNVGETALLRSALGYCNDSVVVTLPAYRLVEAASIPKLIQRLDSGADLVVASRSSEKDPLVNRLQRRIVHTVVRHAVGGDFHDLGSGVRAIRTEVLKEIPLYGESARFLPLLAQREGFTTEELRIPQHARDQRSRVYSPGIYLRRFLDLAGVFFLMRFREKPLRFFGLVGSGLTAMGGLILAVLAVQKLGGRALADRPMLLLAVLFVVVGMQALAMGLVGEIIVHTTARRTQTYRVSRRVESP